MELDCLEWAQLHLAQFGVTEPLTMERISEMLRPGDVFVDIGAHVGFVSLVARQNVGESGLVVAVEPQPYNCERILRNWYLNGYSNLKLHVAAAGSEEGIVTLPQQAATDKSRLSLKLKMPNSLDVSFQVPLVTVSSVVKQHRLTNVKVLKVDVEGFELDVLRGAADVLPAIQNIIFESLGDGSSLDTQSAEVIEWLTGRGFEISTVDFTPWRPGVSVPERNLIASRITR